MYWSTDPLYATPIFPAVMSRNRYELLLRYLHFNDNSNLPPASDQDRDRPFKIKPLLDHLFEKFQTSYEPHREVSVDESLMLWKGRLLFKQYLPLKCHRFGLKLYKLCESTTGYTYRFQVYAGKDSQFTLPPGVLTPTCPLSATEKIVWFLMLPLLNKGYHLYCDNFYTSPALFDLLWQFIHQLVALLEQIGKTCQNIYSAKSSKWGSHHLPEEEVYLQQSLRIRKTFICCPLCTPSFHSDHGETRLCALI